MLPRPLLAILLLLNMLVLAGQLWPEAAPPFARGVNILFLVGSLSAYLYLYLQRSRLLGTRSKDRS